MHLKFRLPVLGTAFFLFVSCGGCNDDESQNNGTNNGTNNETIVGSNNGTNNGVPVVASGACRVDTNCASGTYCDLGRCVVGCAEAEDCEEGQACNTFGRCESDGGGVAVVADRRGRLDLRPQVFPALTPEDGPVPLTLHARDADVDRLRIVASDGLTFDCPAPETDGECIIEEPLAQDTSLVLEVSATRAAGPTEVREIKLYTTGRVQTVSVAPAEADAVQVLTNNPSGLWEGSLHVVEDGFLTPDEDRFGPTIPQQFPLSASIYVGGVDATGVMVLQDLLGVLRSDGAWIGTLDLSGTDNSLALPTYLRHGGLGTGAPTMLRVEAFPGPLNFDADSRVLHFDLTTHTRGMMYDGEGVLVKYRVTLRRTADLPAGARAPTVPASETMAVDGDACVRHGNTVFPPTTCPDFSDLSLTGGDLDWNDYERCPTDLTGNDTCQRAGREPIPWENLARRREYEQNGDSLTLAEMTSTRDIFAGRAVAPLDHCFFGHDDFTRIRAYGPPGWQAPMTGPFVQWGDKPEKTFTQWTQENDFYAAFANFFVAQGYSADSLFKMTLDEYGVTADGGGTTGWLRSDIPCQFDIPAIDMEITCGTTETRTFPATSVDMCDQVAAQMGCEILDEVPLNPLALTSSRVYGTDPTCGGSVAWTMDLDVQRVCRLKAVPESCSQTVLCAGNSAVGPIDPLTGEYPCVGGSLVGISADVRAAEAAAQGQAIPTDELFESCLRELDVLFESGPTMASTEDLAALLAPSDCIAPVRFFTALGVALATNQSLRLIDENFPNAMWQTDAYGRSLRNERVAHRLVQRWLQIHAFLAREGADREVLGKIVREEGVLGEEVPKLDDILAASLRGWELFHHPRYALALSELDGDVLVSPDWRAELDPAVVSQPHHEHGKALSVVILETLTAQFDLASAHVEAAGFASNPAAFEGVRPLFVEAEYMRAWAAGLKMKADAAAAEQGNALPWQDDYQTALVRFQGAQSRLMGLSLDLLDGRNPLGIEESDLPLYFFGGQQDPGSRFAAISDFLLGKPGAAQVGWATQLIDSADTSFLSARSKWLDLKNRGWQTSRDGAAQQDKEAEVRLAYGDAINDLCFLDTASIDVLDLSSIDADSCYVNTSEAGCQVDVRTFARSATAADISLQLCVAGRVMADGHLGLEFGDPVLTQMARAHMTSDDPCSTRTYDAECTDFGDSGCMRCDLPGGELVAPINPTSLQVTTTSSMAGSISAAQTACKAEYPGGRTAIPTFGGSSDASCLRGAMGESQLTVLAAATDIEIAKAELDEYLDAYDIAMNACIVLQTANSKITEATDKHRETMEGLREQKFVADTIANVASGVKDCADSATSAAGGNLGAGAATASAATSCAAAATEAAANIASDKFQQKMDNAQAKHEAAVGVLERTAAVDVCKTEAELHKVGMDAATLRIRRAADDMVLAMYALEQQKREVDVLFSEGKVELGRVEGRAVSPPTAGLWLDEDVREFRRRMRLARRTTYLAVRALEYEFQASLGMRSEVLNAVTPNELRAVADELRTVSATRGINGSRPSDLKVVLSMRDHLLQMAERGNPPVGYPELTASERFRYLLGSPHFKAYDQNGDFVGLRIPFEIAPLEALGLGSPAGISIFAGNDCAERLWSANASIVGTDDVMRGGSSFTRMDLLKRNTFYSQWCGSPQGGTDYQEASVRPSRNLFREPGFGTELGANVLGLSKATDAFTRARLQPAVNVPRDSFEDDAYANGQTAELAGRGLYGNYELFIPANMLSVVTSGRASDGLDLNEIEDILLRLDYVSVAQ